MCGLRSRAEAAARASALGEMNGCELQPPGESTHKGLTAMPYTCNAAAHLPIEEPYPLGVLRSAQMRRGPTSTVGHTAARVPGAAQQSTQHAFQPRRAPPTARPPHLLEGFEPLDEACLRLRIQRELGRICLGLRRRHGALLVD